MIDQSNDNKIDKSDQKNQFLKLFICYLYEDNCLF